MNKTHEEFRTEVIEVLDDVICNKCGLTLNPRRPGEKEPEIGYDPTYGVHIEYTGGDRSYHIGDQARVDLHLCEPCLKALCESCGVQPTITGGL